MLIKRKRLIAYVALFGLYCSGVHTSVESHPESIIDPLLGPRVQLPSFWVGKDEPLKDIPILVLAGHADSQGMNGAGTAGEAVDLKGAQPMDKSMRDELYWNLKIRDEIVRVGTDKGLNISSYDPSVRHLVDETDPRSNWSKGYRHSLNGGYAIEIHFDAYGKYGYGSGLIPALTANLNTIDESLAQEFGRYPILFRGGLGSPRRQIRILEVGKLEGELENNLRNTATSETTIKLIAIRIADSILNGLNNPQTINQ